MANKSRSQITITGPDDALDRLLSRAGKPFSLDRLFPTPPDLLQNGRWYDWRLAHWGTKWDLTGVTQKRHAGAVEVRGVTPWQPPLQALQALSGQYPDLRIHVAYRDPGAGTAGAATFAAGLCLRHTE